MVFFEYWGSPTWRCGFHDGVPMNYCTVAVQQGTQPDPKPFASLKIRVGFEFSARWQVSERVLCRLIRLCVKTVSGI